MSSPPLPEVPAPIKGIFEGLRDEITYLHGNWDAFQQLFGDADSVAALNGLAPGAFQLIRFVFRHEFVMAVSRITDPKESFGKPNLTLKQLLSVVERYGCEAGFLQRIKDSERAIHAHCEPIRLHRNKSIGHLDLATALDYQNNPLQDVTSAQIEEALRMLRDFMNDVLGHFTPIHFDFVPVVTGPARNIVIALRKYKQFEREEYERQVAALQSEG